MSRLCILALSCATPSAALLGAPALAWQQQGAAAKNFRLAAALMLADGEDTVTSKINVDAAATAILAQLEADVLKADSLGEPTTDLEARQHDFIDFLLARCKSLVDKDIAAGAGGQHRKDELTAGVSAAKAQVEATEAEVGPLQAACDALEEEQRSLLSEQAAMEASKLTLEKTLVALPGEISRLREETDSLEAQLAELQPALTIFQDEQAALVSQQAELQSTIASSEAEMKERAGEIEDTRLRLVELASTAEQMKSGLVTSRLVCEELEAEATESAAAYASLPGELQRVRDEKMQTAERLAKVEARRAKVTQELSREAPILAELQGEYDEQRGALKASLSELRRMRDECLQVEAAQREIEHNKATTAELLEEVEALRREAPSVMARREATRAEMADALEAVRRFESGPIAEALMPVPAADAAANSTGGASTNLTLGDGLDGDAAVLDARLSQAGRKLERTTAEIEGRLSALSAFSETVCEAMDTAAGRRAAAQAALEDLYVEQRAASETMKLNMKKALEEMDRMESEWDAALTSNAAELTGLRAEASKAADKRGRAGKTLEGMRRSLVKQTSSITSLTATRRSLADEEEALRKRYAVLRKRRLAKLQSDDASFLKSIDFAAAGSALIRFFGSDGKKAEGKKEQ